MFLTAYNLQGFRKTVPDKWEFSNDNFRRGQKELLAEIRRRKSVATIPSLIPDAAEQTLPANSGEDLGSGSTSTSSSRDSRKRESWDTKNAARLTAVLDENKKLKTKNNKLNSELSQTKKQCDELVRFLTRYVKVGPDQINKIASQGSFESSRDDDVDADGLVGEKGSESVNIERHADENGECLKLFGVWMK